MGIDNVYNSFNYNEQFYGASADSLTLWGVEIDWQEVGFDGSSQADMLTDFQTRRGREFYLKLSNQNEAVGFAPVMPGSCTIVLDDPSEKYNPFNTSSALYPYVEPGKDIRITVRQSPDGERVTVFTGTVIDVRFEFSGDTHYAVISSVEKLQDLSDGDVRATIEQDITISDAIIRSLDYTGWPGAKRSIDSSDLIISFWSEDRRGISAINDLSDTECGYFFVDVDGNARYYSQFSEPPITASFGEDELLKNLIFSSPWETVRNRLRVVANPATLGSEQTIWELLDAPPLAMGESREFWARYATSSQQVSAIDIVTPVATTDYTANESADGSGTDATGDVVLSFSPFGQSARITVTNFAAFPVFITLLKVRGKPILQSNSVSSEKVINGGERLFETDTRFRQSSDYPQRLANWLSFFLPVRQNYPKIEIEALPEKQFTPDLFDRISLEIASKSIPETNYIVGSIQHHWLKSNGQATKTTISLEPSRVLSDNAELITVHFPEVDEQQSVTFGNLPYINDIDALSTSFWLYLESGVPTIVSWNDVYVISASAVTQRLVIQRRFSGSNGAWRVDNLPLNTWVHVVVSNYQEKVYFDGVEKTVLTSTSPSGAAVLTTDALFEIGNTFGVSGRPVKVSSSFFVRNVRVYDRAITTAEAATLASDGVVSDGLRLAAPAVPSFLESEYIDNEIGDKPLYDLMQGQSASATGQVFAYAYDHAP